MRIEELSDRCGGLAWLSKALAQLTEGWAAAAEHGGVQVALSGLSLRLAGQATAWEGCLPTSPALDGPRRVVPPAGWEALGDDDFGLASDAGRVAVVARVLLPRLGELVYELQRAATGPGDGHAAWVACHALVDLSADQAACHRVLASLLVDPTTVTDAAAAIGVADLAFVTYNAGA